VVRLILNLCYLSVFITYFSQPAWACFPNYSPERFVPQGIQAPDYFLLPSLGKPYEDILQSLAEGFRPYAIKESISNLPWEIVSIGLKLQGSFQGYYLLSENKVKGYCLLEKVRGDDPCVYNQELQEQLQGKHLLPHYLNMTIPAGLQLTFYEQVKGQNVERIAIITTPTHPEHEWKSVFPNRRIIVMRARYPLTFESLVKPWIEKYFELNLPIYLKSYGQTP
jgi:hypothetical protein